ncbi:MFS general substrate transporter [Lepidopterella palustris CBS 459.81]|uniref:MFS general substrate transporter n=1 Tax=Lepidopterella palustris CBS 459.81 TaxID=1314670 RepID=A0A8E2JB09_9PEZI|nr:MFS general substrate transporter [Lepidopterella palustris CBS 459.81]
MNSENAPRHVYSGPSALSNDPFVSRPITNSNYSSSESLQDGESDGSKSANSSDSGSRSSRDEKNNSYAHGRGQSSQSLFLSTNIQTETGLPHIDEDEQVSAANEKPVTWRSLPRKDQLLILTLARLSEPLTQTSLGAYLFYQLKSFDPSLPDSTISSQAGILQAAFPGSQFLTAILWGRFADSEWGGRKRVLMIGLLGTACSVIGFGFSRNFTTAVVFRCLGGVLNGNIGVMRTMISEIIKEKKYQSRAFLILPMTFNIGVIIGPILGGILADPVGSYPSIFGPGSALGGKNGVYWMTRWPYALPNLMSAIFLLASAFAVILFLEETDEVLKQKTDYGLRLGNWVRRKLFGRDESYSAVPMDETFMLERRSTDLELQPTPTSANSTTPISHKPARRRKLPFRRIWTRNVIITLISHGLLAMHVGTFNSLWFIYLSAPRFDPAHPIPPNHAQHGPIHFTGGLALPPPRIGLALAILGFIGIILQLALYPRLSHWLGTALSYRLFLLLFPITYTLAPYLSIIPSTTKAPHPVEGPLVWASLTGILFIQVLARTFALPSATILVNNCCPHPSVLGTVHSLGQSVSSATRTVGPILGGWIFGTGLNIGVVGLAWWTLAGVAVAGAIAGTAVREGDGHEILIEGEVLDDESDAIRRRT